MRPIFKLSLLALAAATTLSGPVTAQTPTRGGTLTAALDIEPASLDPIFGNAPSLDRKVFNLIYENLLLLDDKGQLQPALATSWEIAEDQKSITFKLRPGVTFHDGTPFNAQAVKFNIERTINPATNSPHASTLAGVSGVDVVDDMTARINLSFPSGAVIAGLASEAGSMASPNAVQSLGKDFGRKPVGTGPFVFSEWRSADRVTVKKNDKYWRKDTSGGALPYLSEVVVRFMPNPAVKLLEVKAGSVQLSDNLQVKDFADVDANKELKRVPALTGIHQWMSFNVTKPPLDNKDLRQAINYAINRDALNKVVSRGFGTVTPTLVTENEWIFIKDLPAPTHDIAKAKDFLAKSGFKGELTVSVIQRDPDTQIAQLVQAMLREAGITLKVEVLERQAWVDKVLKKNYELGMLRINVPRPDPDQTFGTTFGRKAGSNWSGIQDEAIFKAVDEAVGTLDRDKRRTHYIDAQRLLLENAYYAFLFTRPVGEVATAKLNNLKFELSGAWHLDQAWLQP
jgi:peptide/nickel transport system substrate-binding protein